MQDLTSRLTSLSRPQLMIETARHGQKKYIRNKHLHRAIGQAQTPGIAAGLARLLDLEHEMNRRRKQQNPGYSLVRHVELLIALLSESELYLAAQHAKTGVSPVREPPVQSCNAQRDAELT